MFFYLEIYIIITKFNKTFNCKVIKFFATGYMNRLTNTTQMAIIGPCRRPFSTLATLLLASSIRARLAMLTSTGWPMSVACVR